MFSQGLPALSPFSEADRVGSFGAATSGGRTVSPDFFQQNQHNGYSQQWNLTLQKQLPSNMLLEAQYQANVAHKLGGPNYNYNMIPLVGGRGPRGAEPGPAPLPALQQRHPREPGLGQLLLPLPQPEGGEAVLQRPELPLELHVVEVHRRCGVGQRARRRAEQRLHALRAAPPRQGSLGQRHPLPPRGQRGVRAARRAQQAPGRRQSAPARGGRRMAPRRHRRVPHGLALRDRRADEPQQRLQRGAAPRTGWGSTRSRAAARRPSNWRNGSTPRSSSRPGSGRSETHRATCAAAPASPSWTCRSRSGSR